jgi:hypothetical protein
VFASQRRFARVHALAELQEARALLLSSTPERALKVLNGILSRPIASSDDVICFYAHFYLSKVYTALGDPLRSHVELEQAKYFVGLVDQASKEAVEVRGLR